MGDLLVQRLFMSGFSAQLLIREASSATGPAPPSAEATRPWERAGFMAIVLEESAIDRKLFDLNAGFQFPQLTATS